MSWYHAVLGALFGIACYCCALAFRTWRQARREREAIFDRIRRRRLQVASLGVHQIPAGECRTIELSPERPFRLACTDDGLPWISIPGTVSEYFIVESVSVGAHEVASFVAATRFPNETTPSSIASVSRVMAVPGETIAIRVRNVDHRGRTFCGMFMGAVDSADG